MDKRHGKCYDSKQKNTVETDMIQKKKRRIVHHSIGRKTRILKLLRLAGVFLALIGILFCCIFFPLRCATKATPAPVPEKTETITPSATPTAQKSTPQHTAALQKAPTEYAASLTLNGSTVKGMQQIRYQNSTGVDLYAIALNLYPNAQRAKSLSVTGAYVDQKPVAFTYADEAQTVLILPLYRELAAGETANIYVEFTLRLGTRTSLTAILPRIAPFENGLLRETPLTEHMKPEEAANFHILIATQPGITVSCEAGESTKSENSYYITAENTASVNINITFPNEEDIGNTP